MVKIFKNINKKTMYKQIADWMLQDDIGEVLTMTITEDDCKTGFADVMIIFKK